MVMCTNKALVLSIYVEFCPKNSNLIDHSFSFQTLIRLFTGNHSVPVT